MKIIFCWLGLTDIKASKGDADAGQGPIIQALSSMDFDKCITLCDLSADDYGRYIDWAKRQTKTELVICPSPLKSPIDFGEIYEAATAVIIQELEPYGHDAEVFFHLSPGTPAMAAVWILMAKTRFPATLIRSSKESGAEVVNLPFDISADYIPDLLRKPDQQLVRLSEGLPPEAPEFETIIHRSPEMKRVITMARRMAPRNIPVLIQGESGTGKELVARAMHNSSPRNNRPFVAVNCGAIPEQLVDSELFGHTRGAFTGADRDRAGYFEAAHGGTLFLDELGDLPRFSQVKLLRALQEGVIHRIGSTDSIEVDVRVISATNRNLLAEVSAGSFREDLYHRIAVGVLTLPPLRERSGDLSLLVDSMFNSLKATLINQPGELPERLTAAARELLLRHSWPGNVRELNNVLLRLLTLSPGKDITGDDARHAILSTPNRDMDILGRKLGNGFDIQEVVREVVAHYLKRALEESHGVKSKAAKLTGLSNYQTFTNWMDKYLS